MVQPASPAAERLTILLADDHEVMRLAMRHALQPLAARIQWCEAADAAQVDAQLAGGVDLDLALIDLHMPGMDGMSTIARWRREHPALPLVILSATEDPALVRELAPHWKIGVSGAALSGGAYWIAIWAMTQAPIASVAALRETSILVVMLLSMRVLKETVTLPRLAGAVLIVAGAMLIRLS